MRKSLLVGLISSLLLLTSVSAWWDSSYYYRYKIISNITTGFPVSVNDTSGACGNIIWALIDDDSYLYCEQSGCCNGRIAIANETDEKYWESDTTRTGNNPTSVWNSANAKGVWHMNDESGIVYDSSQNNHGTMINFPANPVVSGKFEDAIDFDGVDDYINCGTSDTLRATNTFSIEVWVKDQDWNDGSYNAWVFRRNNYALYKSSNNAIRFLVYYSGTSEFLDWMDASSLIDSEWYHVVGTYENDVFKVYVNGDMKATKTVSGDIRASPGESLGIGKYITETGYEFDGTLDEVRFHNKILTQTEIQQHYWNGINNLTTLGDEQAYLNINFTDSTILNQIISDNFLFLNITSTINLSHAILEWNGIDYKTMDGSGKNWYFNQTNLTDGNHSFKVFGIDIYGNSSNTTTYWIVVDATPPILSNPIPNDNGFFNNPSSVFSQVDLTEYHFNIFEDVTIYWRREDVGSWKSSILECYGVVPHYTCNNSVNVSEYLGIDRDVMEFFFKTKDILNQEGELANESYPLIAIVDTKEPISPENVIFQPDPYPIYDNDGTLVVNWTAATDTISDIKEYKIYVKENDTAYRFNGTNTTKTGYEFTGADGNYYSVKVTSVDLADNENTTGSFSEITITVDTINPTIKIVIPENKTYYDLTSLPMDYGVNELTSTVSWCGYSLDGSANITLPDCINTTLQGLSYSTHHLIVYANDSANNMGSSEVYFTVNKTDWNPPVVTIHSPEAKNYQMEKLWLKVTADIPVDTWEYKLNSGSNITFTPNITIDVAQCFNELTVYASSSGNEGFNTTQFNALTGDVDGDLDVDIFDIVKCAGGYGSSPAYPPECDIVEPPDGNGAIDIFDIVAIAGKYGNKC